VQRGRSAGARGSDRALDFVHPVGEVLQNLDAAVEIDDLRDVLLAQLPGKPHGRLLRELHAVLHARAGVNQQ
jgi:hypothetical protein